MALTDDQKSKVRYWLGYPDGFRASFSDLEGGMSSLSTFGEARVTDALSQLDTIDAQLQTSWGRQKVVKAEEVTLAGHDEIRALWMEGRRLVRLIANTLGVTPRVDVFSAGGSGAGIARRGA